MPIPTDPVKRVCYADDLTMWASGVNIPDLEVSISNYLEEINAYLKDNYLLISAQKSSVTSLTPDTHQVKIQPSIMPKDIGGLSGSLLIIQQAQPVCGRERESIR